MGQEHHQRPTEFPRRRPSPDAAAGRPQARSYVRPARYAQATISDAEGGSVGESDGARDSLRSDAAPDDPVLNGPYDPPTRFFEIGPKGPTGTVIDGRRPSESFIPVPKPKKKRKKGATPNALQLALALRPGPSHRPKPARSRSKSSTATVRSHEGLRR